MGEFFVAPTLPWDRRRAKIGEPGKNSGSWREIDEKGTSLILIVGKG
jgi:hypothetical protein